jgi:hypothetical protein
MAQSYGKGWHLESKRHALAAKGILTKFGKTFTMQYPVSRHEVEEDKVQYNKWGNLQVLAKKMLHDTDGDGVPDRDDCCPYDATQQDSQDLEPKLRQALGSQFVDELKGQIKQIETSVPTTKNHYGQYMAILSQGKTPQQRKVTAMTLIVLGANKQGVLDALNITG